MSVATVGEVLAFWFEELGAAAWFGGGEAVDARVRERLGGGYHAAAEGMLDGWADTSDGALALLILLDQVPRHLFRGQALAFATDERAQELARRAVARAQDMEQPGARRVFFYLPFEHAEEIVLQDCCVALVGERIGPGQQLDHAERHREVIRRFGRFPHRNAALGRPCTPAERDYLDQPGAGF